MKDKNRIQTIWKEWDAFCDLLIEGTRAVDSRKSLPADQKIDHYRLEDYSKELDMFLCLSFSLPADGLPPDTFAETPPLLEKALRARISNATTLLTEILERHGDLVTQSESDPTKTVRMTFQDLLLPPPPKQGEYDWVHPAG
jgi:hypothetical protein